MSAQDSELVKIVKGFRVRELQTLLTYAGRNKGGKKTELQSKALDLIKLHSQPISIKIRELHMSRYQQNSGINETSDLYPLTPVNEGIGNTYQTPSSDDAVTVLISPLNVISPDAVKHDVIFDLPFYDLISEMFQFKRLVSSSIKRYQDYSKVHIFCVTPKQLQLLDSSSDIQVQLRICLSETSCEQEYELPTSVYIKVNSDLVNLPATFPTNKENAEPKCKRRLVDITSISRRTASNVRKLQISWPSMICRPFAAAVFLVRKLSATTLIRRLKANGVRNPHHTRAMIKKKLSQHWDSEIETMSLRGSLICPLGKIKMKLPCRALTCTHLQCFDATLYVQMNEKKPKWICPVCDEPAIFSTLAIDGLFLDIISKAPSECTQVQFHEDGSWTPVTSVTKAAEVSDASLETVPKPKKSVEVISLESDSDTEFDSEPSECWEVQCHDDGPWTPFMPVKKYTC